MSEKKLPGWQDWTTFRFAVIGGLLTRPPESGELQKALAALAEQSYQHPAEPQKQLRLSFATIERWYYQARAAQDPIAVLRRKPRVDAGRRPSISDTLRQTIKTQYQEHPRWSVQLHYDNLSALARERPEITPLPSYKTLLRLMRENGWRRRLEPALPTPGQKIAIRRREEREIRSFEASHVHALWHLDFHIAKIRLVDESAKWLRPVALAILDDYSRLCCHLQFYLDETAECLVHGLTQAFMKRGLPRALLTDNGGAMLAEETQNGLARLGIEHKCTLPYSPYQNGKQEVFWGQLEGRLLELLRGVENLKLGLLNTAAQAWVEQDYHRRLHREIDTTPLQRMLDGHSVARAAPNTEALTLAFTRKIIRTPRRSDATVVVGGIRYELPPHYAHLRALCLRQACWDKSRLILCEPKTGDPLVRLLPQDKAQNASAKRRRIAPPPDIPTRLTDEPLPALLRNWMAEYAATGLPPAYLPKEELEHE
jgi:transposase InsO family protein